TDTRRDHGRRFVVFSLLSSKSAAEAVVGPSSSHFSLGPSSLSRSFRSLPPIFFLSLECSRK
ncbi:hypothetical protein COLO4_29831, partial [Corchorus olitorius]